MPGLHDYDRYLPASDRGRQWGIYVTGGGCGAVLPGRPYPRRGHPRSYEFAWQRGRTLQEYQIVYIPSGEGEFESRPTGPLPVPAGTVMVLFPGVWHRYRPCQTTGWEEYWVGFAGEDAGRLQSRGFFDPRRPLWKTGRDDLLLHAFQILLDRLRGEPLGFEPLLAASLWEIVATMASAAATNEAAGSRLHDLVRRAKAILEDQSEEVPVIEQIAAQLGLSTSRLQHLFKQATGFSPYQYHLHLKIRRAEEMLRGADLSVKQIAQRLHFHSVYHFSTLFKRKTGLAPSQYREGRPADSRDARGRK